MKQDSETACKGKDAEGFQIAAEQNTPDKNGGQTDNRFTEEASLPLCRLPSPKQKDSAQDREQYAD
jgi:hypothetical protein